jgi:dipeptidyl-peptidase-3
MIQPILMNAEKPYTSLGYPDEGCVTAYFSKNMTREDLAVVKAVLVKESIGVENTRAYKLDSGVIVITIGSVEKHVRSVQHEGRTVELHFGEFASYLKDVVYWLQKALPYCANPTQEKMIEHYINHYQTGSIEEHKQS